jgi:hypothetical protein
MNGCTWALLSAYASFLGHVGEWNEAQRLTLVLFPLEPSSRDIREAMSNLEQRGLISGYRLTLTGLQIAEAMAKVAAL